MTARRFTCARSRPITTCTIVSPPRTTCRSARRRARWSPGCSISSRGRRTSTTISTPSRRPSTRSARANSCPARKRWKNSISRCGNATAAYAAEAERFLVLSSLRRRRLARLCLADQGPQVLWRQRQRIDRHAERPQRVLDGTGDSRRGTHATALAAALDAVFGKGRRRLDMPDDNIVRQFVHRRNHVVHEIRRQELAVAVVVIALVE